MIRSVEGFLLAATLIYLLYSNDRGTHSVPRIGSPFVHHERSQSSRVGGLTTRDLVRGSKKPLSYKRSLIAALDNEDSIIVFGPTRSGKTRNVAAPIVKSSAGSVVVTSVKKDIVNLTYAERVSDSKVYFLGDRCGLDGTSYYWDPVDEVRDFQSAKAVADNLVSHAPGNFTGAPDTKLWYQLSSRLLAPVMLAAMYRGLGINGVISWLDSGSFQEPYEILQHHHEDQGAQTIDSVRYWDEKQISSVLITILSVVQSVELALSSVPVTSKCLVVADLFAQGAGAFTLYMTTDFAHQRRLAPYFGALNSTLASSALARGDINSRLTFVLDEAANTAPMVELAELASLGQGLGVRLVTILQDVSQLKSAYSLAANTVVNNHRAKLFLAGISDPETASLAESLISASSAFPLDFAVRTLSNRTALLVQANARAELVRFNARRRYFFR